MTSNIWISLVNLLTVTTIALAVIYVLLWTIKYIISKVSANVKSRKLEVIEHYLNMANKIVTKMIIGAWLVLVIMNIVDSLPELKQIIKTQLGEIMTTVALTVNQFHFGVQLLSMAILFVAVMMCTVFGVVMYRKKKSDKDEENTDMY